MNLFTAIVAVAMCGAVLGAFLYFVSLPYQRWLRGLDALYDRPMVARGLAPALSHELSHSFVRRYNGVVGGRAVRVTMAIERGDLLSGTVTSSLIRVQCRDNDRGPWSGSCARYECVTRATDTRLQITERQIADRPIGKIPSGPYYCYAPEWRYEPCSSGDPALDTAFRLHGANPQRGLGILMDPHVREVLLGVRMIDLLVEPGIIRLDDLSFALDPMARCAPPSDERIDAILSLLSVLAARLETAP